MPQDGDDGGSGDDLSPSSPGPDRATGAPALEAAAPVAARASFARSLFGWLFGFSLPVGLGALALLLYVHEIAHGLAAVLTGGRFLGFRSTLFDRESPVMAYADAWSDGWDGLVSLAGIGVSVVIGLVLLRRGLRAEGVLRRLVLLTVAIPFLGDLGYALDGCLDPESEYDTATFLSGAGLPGLRWVGIPVFLAAYACTSFLLARGLFRTWEEIFGSLSAGRAFWLVLLLVHPVPLPSLRGPHDPVRIAVYLLVYVAIFTGLLRSRRGGLPALRSSPPVLASLAAAVAALIAFGFLERGIRLDTVSASVVFDVRPAEQAVAGFTARYGLGDRFGENRSVESPELFVAFPDGVRTVRAPAPELVDLAWVSSRRRFVVVTAFAVQTVDDLSGASTTLWQPGSGTIWAAALGPGGEAVALFRDLDQKQSLYVHDPHTGQDGIHPVEGDVGPPFFRPGPTPRAVVSVGENLWEFTWTAEAGVSLHVQVGASAEGWLEGYSEDVPWWADDEGWWTGKARVANRGIPRWGAVRQGLFTWSEEGTWKVTSPEGVLVRSGTLETSRFVSFRIDEGDVWVVLKGGDVLRLGDATPAFRTALPP